MTYRPQHLNDYGRAMASAIGLSSWVEAFRDEKQAYALNAIHSWHRDNRLFFIHVPKAAGTSVRDAIGSPFMPEYPHVKANTFRRMDEALFDSAYSFAVIRHPVDRFLSAYAHVKRRELHNHDPILHRAQDFLNWPLFLKRFESSHWYRSIVFSALHFQPQWMFVSLKPID